MGRTQDSLDKVFAPEAFIISASAMEAFRTVSSNRRLLGRFLGRVDEAAKFLRALKNTNSRDSLALVARPYFLDGVVTKMVEHYGHANDVMGILREVDESQRAGILSSDNAVATLVAHGHADEVMNFIWDLDYREQLAIFCSDGAIAALAGQDAEKARELIGFISETELDGEINDVARMFATDGVVASLCDAGYAHNVMDYIRRFNADQKLRAFSTDRAVASLVKAGYAEEIWTFIDDSKPELLRSMFSSNGAIEALVEDREDADYFMRYIMNVEEDNRQAGFFAADGVVEVLDRYGYGRTIQELVASYSHNQLYSIRFARGAAEVLDRLEVELHIPDFDGVGTVYSPD